MHSNKLEEKVWYDVADKIKLINMGGGIIRIDYNNSLLTIDIVDYMRAMYFHDVLLPVIDALKKGEDIRNDVFSSLSDADLQGLMTHHTEKEEFEICAKIKKEIDARASEQKEV